MRSMIFVFLMGFILSGIAVPVMAKDGTILSPTMTPVTTPVSTPVVTPTSTTLHTSNPAHSYDDQLQLQVGSNYLGRSLQLSYGRKIVGPLWISAAVETGTLAVTINGGQGFTFNGTTIDNYVPNLNMQDLVSLGLGLHREDTAGTAWRWFNSVTFGISHYDLTLNLTATSSNPTDTYTGQKNISAYAFYTEIHFLDFYPDADRFLIALGLKGYITSLPSPQTITIDG